MATVLIILEAITAALKFPKELAALIKLLEKAPEEKRQEIVLQVDAWMKESSSSERPHWEQT